MTDGPRGAGVLETLEGVVEGITFANAETGWAVIRFLRRDGDTPDAVVGFLPGVQSGETLRLTGEWVVEPRFGRQFRVETFVPVLPSTATGIEKYLGSGLIRNVGKEMARRLVEAFGEGTLDVIEREPHRLGRVPGIGRKRMASIVAAWQEQRVIREVMVFLRSVGISAGHAARIFKRFGARSVAAVREDPYRLAEELRGVGFTTADGIARNLGIAHDAPRRVAAGILEVVREGVDEGHCWFLRSELEAKAAAFLEVEPSLVTTGVAGLLAAERLVASGEELAPGFVGPRDLAAAEAEVARRLALLLSEKPSLLPGAVEPALAAFEKRSGLTLEPMQRDAVTRALSSAGTVITGGPGTGKTTLVNALIGAAAGAGLKVGLCAPTGRAAKRLAEASGREAKTIHRLLEFSPREMRFQRDEAAQLPLDLLVVDEVSMVDLPLFLALLRALRSSTRLVLVGDSDQLPSVGPGAVLRDLVASEALPVVRLRHVFRQAAGSRIVVNAHRVNEGQSLLEGPGEGDSDFFFVPKESPEDILEVMKRMVSERIPRRFGVDPRRDVQILTPMHRGLLGARNLNDEFQKLLNPRGPSLTRGGTTFRRGDRVMQTVNDYDKDAYNGDVGWVEAVDEDEGRLRVRMDERLLTYEGGEIDSLILAYACSIHKSQGSEYPVVVLPLHTQHYVMLRRNLLYTAITRGRRLVVLVGSARAVALAVADARTVERTTLLARSLVGDGRAARRSGGTDGC